MNFAREDTVLGTKKVVIGDKFHDLVLENLGKIYIRYGNSYKEFNAIMLSLSKGVASGGSKVIIEENGISDDLSIYPNGSLIYDANSGILYLIYNEEAFILAEHVNTNSSRYVLKTGDTMTGQLIINTKEAPLKVKSTELVKNFNANYLQGYDASAFARRNHDETINGSWTFTGKNKFTNKNTFEDTAIFNGRDKNAAIRVGAGNIVTDGSMGSSVFVSGMNGSGWRLDSETNTLEIDNLIVRGVLNVYELVVNKVSATNGSLWITDSFKVKTIHTLEKIEYTAGLTFSNIDFSLNKYYLFYQNVTLSETCTSFALANNLLDLYNHAKITVPGEALSTRTHKGTNSVDVDVYKYVFQIISINKLKTFVSEGGSVITPLDLCKANILELLQIAGIIDFTCIYLYNMQDIPDKMLSANDVFNVKFDLNNFRIVTNPKFEDGKYYFYNMSEDTAVVNLYYKYFGGGELYILESENDEYPVFKPGDVLRCLKFTGKSVKQYYGIVCGLIGAYGFIMQLQNHSILNRKTEVGYDDEGNLLHFDSSMDDALYNRSNTLIKSVSDLTYNETDGHIESGLDKIGEGYQNGIRNLNSTKASEEKAEAIEEYVQSDEFKALCTPQEGDGIVRVGSIVWGVRRNSMYLTSSENYSPFQDIMVGVNRPDYGVVYFTPKIRKCTILMIVDELNEIYKEQEVYLLNTEFCLIMDLGFQYLDEIKRLEELDPESLEYVDAVETYNDWLSENDGQIFSQYKDIVQRIDVPKSLSDKGDLEFYGLTNVKDVYLTYTENNYKPKYYNKNGERIKVSAKVTLLNSSFYTAPKLDNQPIKVILVNKGVNEYEKTIYLSEGSLSKILAIGWRI